MTPFLVQSRRPPVSLRLLPVVGLLGLFALAASAQSKSPSASDARIGTLLASLDKVQRPQQAAISPDGTTVAWTAASKSGTSLHLSSVASPSAATDRIISTAAKSKDGRCDDSLPTWSPDGQTLAFTSTCTGDAGSGQAQIFLWSKVSGTSRQLTHLTGSIAEPAWSPDGRSIAFLFVENASRTAGALDAMKPAAGVIGEDGVEIQRVAAADITTGRTRYATSGELHVYEFDWAPDSEHLAFVGANPPGENNWWIARLYSARFPHLGESSHGTNANACIYSAGGICYYPVAPSVVFDPAVSLAALKGLQIAVPRYSPDGKQIAFIGGLMSDQGSTGGDIYVVPSAGGAPTNLTPGRPSSPTYLRWIDDTKIGLSEHVGGSSRIAVLDLSTGQDLPGVGATFPESIGAGEESMSVSTSRTAESVAFIRSSFDRAPEVWAGPLSDLKQISHLNDGLKPAWGKAEDITWSNDGFKVEGWLLYPASYDPTKRYPLVVMVHGGPSSAMQPGWPSAGFGGAPFSALGYFVFMPNPRGSYGQGEKFTAANIRDFGRGDLRDILAGMDVLEKRFPIDKEREGLTGWSYGGFMTMFGVTQTPRFKAAVAGAGISDWKSYYGENSIDQWMVPFFGASVYDDPDIYAKASAIEYIKQVKTPTLIVVGDRDGECPAPQSYEFWHALRAQGVKTQLVIYPAEGHRFRDPAHRADVLARAVQWFDTEMPAR